MFLAPLIAVIWWVAIWGLIELAMDGWTKDRRMITYLLMLVAATTAATMYPDARGHL
jgi:hypothetical protein